MANYIPNFQSYLSLELGRSPSTIAAYIGDLSRVFKHVHAPHESVTASELREYLGTLTGKSPRYFHRILSALRSYFDFLHRVKKVRNDNPAMEIQKPKLSKRHPPSLSMEDVRAVITAASEHSRPNERTRNWTLLTFLYYSGLRVSELTNLTMKKISYKDGLPNQLSVIGKGDKERTVILADNGARALNAWLDHRRDLLSGMAPHETPSHVWITGIAGDYHQISPRTVQHICKRFGNKAGVSQSVHPHLFRHTFATESARHGGALHALRDALGHASLATTGIYLHANTSDLEKLSSCLPSTTE